MPPFFRYAQHSFRPCLSTSSDARLSVTDSATNKGKNIEFIRNGNMKQCVHGSDPRMPNRTKNDLSPTGGTNQHSTQPATRAPVEKVIQHEWAEAQYSADGLADQMFGHLVSTELAKYILRELVSTGDVQVYKGDELPKGKDAKLALDPDSEGVLEALDDACEDVKRHGCVHPESGEEDVSSREGEKQTKGKEKEKMNKEQRSSYLWRWKDFPANPINGDKLVAFLNKIADQAFDLAEPRLHVDSRKNHRFAASKGKRDAVPSHGEADGEGMCPDLLVLPIEAFSSDPNTVDERYVNFTALRVVGESKSTDYGSGLTQVHRYTRGIKRAQPWVPFVTAVTVMNGRVALLRGEGSGTERLELTLCSGRGCIEFIRILLSLALAQGEDLGRNPEVALGRKEVSCRVENPEPVNLISAVTPALECDAASSAKPQNGLSQQGTNHPSPSSSRGPADTPNCSHVSDVRSSVTNSPTLKRRYHAVYDTGLVNSPKRRKVGHVNQVVFVPVMVYGYRCMGILFTCSSVCGRGTTVFCVFSLDDDSQLFALMAWQDLEREEEHGAVLQSSTNNKPHPNGVTVVKIFKASRKGNTCTTLEAIRGLRPEELCGFAVENRALTISVSELKRPVKYFWGVHDFVRGLRGALVGHEYLTQIGVLHRDISENNIVLARRPGEERGYLIDFDMATLQDAEEKPVPATTWTDIDDLVDSFFRPSSPIPMDGSKPLKGHRTGTMPYMSFSVLRGRIHTHYDDIESFLYILLLFFFSYAGPLSKDELLAADARGFVHPLGSGPLAHTRCWPETYIYWAEGDVRLVSSLKSSDLNMEDGARRLLRSAEMKECMANDWPARDLQRAIQTLLGRAWQMFIDSRRCASNGLSLERTNVTHGEFVGLLDRWLEEFADIEDKYSSCPFY